jgi:hypothetical protein
VSTIRYRRPGRPRLIFSGSAGDSDKTNGGSGGGSTCQHRTCTGDRVGPEVTSGSRGTIFSRHMPTRSTRLAFLTRPNKPHSLCHLRPPRSVSPGTATSASLREVSLWADCKSGGRSRTRMATRSSPPDSSRARVQGAGSKYRRYGSLYPADRSELSPSDCACDENSTISHTGMRYAAHLSQLVHDGGSAHQT